MLGPVEVSVDGTPIDLGGPRQQLIVAGLLFHAGQVVTVPDLVELVWDEDPPVTARNQLQTVVYRLRRLLGPDGGALRTDPAGYRMAVPDEHLDLARFRSALTRARAAGGEAAAASYRAALDEWRGTPFAGLPGSVIGRWRDSLVELRWAATEEWADTVTRLGRHREVVEVVAPLVAAQPVRERLAGALMTALHCDGRQAEALRLYQRTVAALRDELGVDPGPRLRDLHLEVLRGAGPGSTRGSSQGSTREATPAPAGSAPPGVGDAPPGVGDGPPGVGALPRPAALLRGRERETERLLRAVRGGYRIVVVDGMAGVGKSAFTLTAAETLRADYPSAQVFVDLQGHSEAAPVAPLDALELLLTRAGVAAAGIPQDLAGRQALWWRTLAAECCVVVLDNVAGVEQVLPLLPPAGTPCLVLVTSRTRIGPVDGAFPLSLDPLPVGDAISVLRDAIGERVDAEPAAAAEAVELCGRLPLAVRLIAHRLQHRPRWSVAAMVERLRAADPPPIAVSAEGRSVAAAFDVSYRQLGDLEQRCFRLLGLHPAGEFEVWPAAALAEVSVRQARDLLDRLVEVHLLEEDEPGRFRLHDLMRDFAATLVGADERPAALSRLLDYYLSTAAAVNGHLEIRRMDTPVFPPSAVDRPLDDAPDALAWMRTVWPALVALAGEAHRTGAHWHAIMLHRVLWRFANNEGRSAVSERLGRQAIASATALGDDGLIGLATKWHAGTLSRLGRGTESIRYLKLAAAHYSAAGLRIELGSIEVNLGIVVRTIGRLDESLEHFRAALTIYGDIDEVGSLRVLSEIGAALLLLGRPDEARLVLRETILGMHRRGGRMQVASTLISFARAHLALGHARLALLLLRRSRRMNEEIGNISGAAESLSDLGLAHAALGDLDAALRCQVAACGEVRHLADPFYEPGIRNSLGATLTLLGRTEEAIAEHERALLLTRHSGQRYEEGRAHTGIADALRRAGRDDTAERAAPSSGSSPTG